MNDVTDERLAVLVERAKAPANTSQEIYAGELAQLVEEIQRRRGEPSGREHVERVALEAITDLLLPEGIMLGRFGLLIARRVADRLSVPVLSEEEISILKQMRQDAPSPIHDGDGCPTCVQSEATLALLDRLIAAGKP